VPAAERDWFAVLPDGLVVAVEPEQWATSAGAWLHVDTDGVVTAFTGKVDVGQGNRTALSLLVAAELGVPVETVRLVMGDTDLCPYDRGTFGSRSIPDAAPLLRAAAAAARRSLAARPLEPGERRVELATGGITDARQAPPATRKGGLEIVTGSAVFPSDVTRPGLVHGSARDRVPWELPAGVGESELELHLRSHPAGEPSTHDAGDAESALAEAPVRLDATYTTAYIAHVPLETRAAVAEWEGERLTVWTGTQRPFGVRAELAEELGVPEEHVRVIAPTAGSAFGGKHRGEVATEAARLARAGQPVKVHWSRAEEFEAAYVRPAAVIDVRSGAWPDGRVTAWDFLNIGSGAAGIGCPYAIPNQQIAFQPADSPLRWGSYRGIGATANHFARESHLDELAHRLGVDPVELRLRHLEDERLADVLRAAAERAGWNEGRFLGIACGVEKGAYVATCAEVLVEGESARVTRIVTAFDCGAIVDRDNLVNQIEGATIMGLGGALFERVRFAHGRLVTRSLSEYRVPRFSDVPSIDVVLLDRPDVPSKGAGETPIVCVAPAVANALFSATGVRRRSLPLEPGG
jgi:isoquinoline 1-oxidoreductase